MKDCHIFTGMILRILIGMIALQSIALCRVWGIWDEDGDGLSDVWERYYQASELLPEEDSDGDGSSNNKENLFGTDPLDPKSVPISYSALTEDELTFSFPTKQGVLYQIRTILDFSSEDGGDLVWQFHGTAFTGDGTLKEESFAINDSSLFIKTEALSFRPDSDLDGLDAYEESLFGTSPLLSNSDTDDLTDLEDFLLELNPLTEYTNLGVRDGEGDRDNDGYSDIEELRNGTDWKDNSDHP